MGLGRCQEWPAWPSDVGDGAEFFSYSALLVSGGVDCWGYGRFGELGNGIFYNGAAPNGSRHTGGRRGYWGSRDTHRGEGVVGLGESYCALLTCGSVDCWGAGAGLGRRQPYSDSATPVAVEGVGGTGILEDVTALFGTGNEGSSARCSRLGEVECWGNGYYGELGDGTSTRQATMEAIPRSWSRVSMEPGPSRT